MARLAERPSRTRTLAAPQSPAAAGRRHRRSAGRAIIPDGSTRVWPGSWGRTAYHGHEPVPLLELTAHDAQIGDVNGADLAVHRHAGCDRMTIVHVFSAYSYWPNGESGPLWCGMIAHVQPRVSPLTSIQSLCASLSRSALIAACLYELFNVCRHSRDESIRRERSGMLYEPGRLEI